MVRVLAGSPRHSKTHRAAFVSPATVKTNPRSRLSPRGHNQIAPACRRMTPRLSGLIAFCLTAQPRGLSRSRIVILCALCLDRAGIPGLSTKPDASGPVLIASRCRFATAGRCTAYRVSKAMNRTIPLRPTISGIRKHLGHFSFYCFGSLLTVEVPTPANEEVDETRNRRHTYTKQPF